MTGEKEIALRIEKIKQIFLDAQTLTQQEDDLNLVVKQLGNTENEFRSVAYEGASLALALKDFSNHTPLTQWRMFMEGQGAKHSAQMHSGLGWAIAQKRIPLMPVIKTLSPLMGFRVLDGCGYYDGICRQRLSIGNQKILQDFDSNFLCGYDQGIGRSLWYICNGVIEKIKTIISQFPSSRHDAIWRGVGIACVYVGGYDEAPLIEIANYANGYHTQLAVSAALVSRTRYEANALTRYIESACRVWCNCSAEEAMKITVKAERISMVHPDDAFRNWISNIEEEFMDV